MGVIVTLWIVLVHSHVIHCQIQSTDEPVDVAIVENDEETKEVLEMSMPTKLNMGIDMIQSAKPVKLSLKINENNNELRNVYVPSTDQFGNKTLVKANIPFQKNIGYYQDLTTGAAVQVECKGLADGRCEPLLTTGSFNVGGEEYTIQMIDSDSPGRTQRSTRRKRHKGRLYKLFKRKRHMASISDYMDSGDRSNRLGKKKRKKNKKSWTMGIKGNSQSGAHRHSESVVNLGGSTSGFLGSHRLPSRTPRPPPRRRGLYHLGLLIVVDFNVYKRFFDATSRRNRFSLRDEEAKANIREHMANIVNGIDLRYNNFETFTIKVVVTGYVIIDKEEDSRWTPLRISKRPRDLLNASIALRELYEWKKQFRNYLPPHDHIMLFTEYDLYVSTFSDVKVAGYAHIKTVCKDKGISVVEDDGGFDNILTATHELAHSLGASHDGDHRYDNYCNPADGYIMTAVGGGTAGDATKGQNSYRFSPCSEEQINNYIDNLGPGHCLVDEDFVYNADEFDSHVSVHLGQKYDPNEQCTLNMGYPSYYAWGGRLGEPKDICTSMACKNRLNRESFNIFNAYRGTSCGDKKWCIDGICTPAELAPGKHDVCVHGDSRRKFGPRRRLSCQKFIAAEPFRCYDPYYSMFCCSTCNKLKRKVQGCEFGDRNITECQLLNHRKDLCYVEANEALCCETCKKHSTGIPGCEYGNRYRFCNMNDCESPENAKFCCETCGTFGEPSIPSIGKPATDHSPTQKIPSSTSKTIIDPEQGVGTGIGSLPDKTSVPVTTLLPLSSTEFINDNKIIIDNNLPWCVKHNKTFFQAPCTWLDKWLKGICSNALFRYTCCQPCPGSTINNPAQVPVVPITQPSNSKGNEVAPVPPQDPLYPRKTPCYDEINCADVIGADCYFSSVRAQCCDTCESFRTDIKDCPHGDRNSRCAPMYSLDPDYTCSLKRNICCFTCRNVNITTSVHLPPARDSKTVTVMRQKFTRKRKNRPKNGKRNGRLRNRNRKGKRIYGQERSIGYEAALKRFQERQNRNRGGYYRPRRQG